jgi:subtilisin family serine protease
MASKYNWIGAVILVGTLFLVGNTKAEFDARDYEGAQWVPGRVTVAFAPSYGKMEPRKVDGVMQFGIPAVDALNAHYGAYRITNILGEGKLNHITNPPDFSRVFLIDLDHGTDIMEACANYSALPGVLYAQPDVLRPVDVIPDDPLFGSQWALPKIGAPEAWDITRGSRDIIITCIDIGVDWDHIDLINNIWVNPDEDLDHDEWVGWAFPGQPIVGDPDDINNTDDGQNGYIDDFYGWDFVAGVSQPGYPGEDTGIEDNNPEELHVPEYAHGTHTTGLTIATTNNALGIAGTNWNARIMCLRAGYVGWNPSIQGYSGMLISSSTARAILYAQNNGANIISMSYGSTGPYSPENDALQSAWSNGLALFASAGNENNQVQHYPACYNNVISVAATDNADHKASYSSYGTWIDISAPGGDFNPGMVSTLPGNTYGAESGTSMASPQCAGAAGLVWAAFPDQTNAWITQALLDYSYDLYPLNPGYIGLLGAGRVDLVILFSNFFPRLTVSGDPVVDDASGNNDHRADPGESASLIVSLVNDGDWQDADEVEVTLVCPNDPYITITDSVSNYGTVASGQEATNESNPFEFTVSSSVQRPYWAHFQLHLTSNNYGYSALLDFQLRIGRPEVILVDDDNGHSFESFYRSDLDDIDVEHDVWSVSTLADIPGDELNRYHYVIWSCGNDTFNTLSANDQTNLANFLDTGGGRGLLLVGQNIDEGISGTSFYSNYLHAQHADGTGNFQVYGVSGDPVSDNTHLMLIGGTGGQNGTLSPSKIDPVGGSSVIYTYLPGGNAAVRYEGNGWKTVYMAFALEAACPYDSTAQHPRMDARSAIISRVLSWFGLYVDVPETSHPTLPQSFALEGNYPNPFNPNTNIAFQLPAISRVSLKVYNVLGQEVATVINGESMGAGRHVVNFDGNNLASGIYFYRLTADRNSVVGKMVLMK